MGSESEAGRRAARAMPSRPRGTPGGERQRDGSGVAAPVDEAPAPHFALTAKIAARNGLKSLSMGMSADFAVAIQFGATHVRVGSAIFGHR